MQIHHIQENAMNKKTRVVWRKHRRKKQARKNARHAAEAALAAPAKKSE